MFILKRLKRTGTFAPLGVDMHCHLLPGVDDGSKSIDMTVDCLRIMKKVGFENVILTPHFQMRYPNDEDDVAVRYARLKAQLDQMDDPSLAHVVTVSGEYRFDQDYARRPGVDRVVPLPGNRLLCEFALHQSGEVPFDMFRKYQSMGYTLILAHPERYPYFGVYSEDLTALREMGVLFQCNILSLVGFYGDGAQQKGMDMIKRGWVEYLGTDLHNMHYAAALQQAADDKEIRKILSTYKFLNNSILSPPPTAGE